MSKQQVKAFIKELNSDDSLKKELKSALDVEEGATFESEEEAEAVINQIVGFAADNDHDFTVEEYKSVIAELQQDKSNLTEEELEQVAGGQKVDGTGDKILLSAVTVGFGCIQFA